MLEIENQNSLTLSSPHTFSTPPQQSCLHPEELTASAANTSGSNLHSKLFRKQRPQSWWVSIPPSPPPQYICIHLPFPPTLSLSLPSPLWRREQESSTISSLPPLSTQAKDGNFQVSCLPSQYRKDDGVQFQPTSAAYFQRAYLATWLAQICKVLHNTEPREYRSVTETYSAPNSSWLQMSLTMFNYLALFMAIYTYIHPQDNKHCNSACNKKKNTANIIRQWLSCTLSSKKTSSPKREGEKRKTNSQLSTFIPQVGHD